MRTNTPEKYFISQLYAHKCQLPPSDDYQHLRRLRKMKNFFLISEKSLESYLKAKSLSGIYYEKRRQVRTTKVIIHPFSKFRKMWMIWMSFVLLLAFIMFPFFSAFHGPVYAKQLYRLNDSFLLFWLILYFVFIIQLACLVDIIVNLYTGYVTETPEEMVIQPWRILRDYLLSYFPFDLSSSLPVDLIYIAIFGVKKYSELEEPDVFILTILPWFKFCRLYTLYKYWFVVFSIFTSSEASYNVLCVTTFFFLFIHWSTCIIVLLSQFIYYKTLFEEVGPPANNSWIYDMHLYERSILSMYVCATYRSVSSVTRLGFELFKTNTVEDKIVSVFLGIFGGVYLLVLLVVFLQATSAVARAKMSYAEIMDQVNEYMDLKKFPKHLKKKVTEYYQCLYQRHYIDEDAILNLASDTLRKEILLRMYQRLIENVNIFSGLSQTLTIRILSKLRPEIYREGEEAFRAGDYPECMFFVSFGTFAFYTEEGLEIGHMDDGNYFGDLSILYNVGRYVTAIAVETSLVYRLSSEDFDEIIRPERTLISKLEKNAEIWIRKVQQEVNFKRRQAERALRRGSFGYSAEDEDDED